MNNPKLDGTTSGPRGRSPLVTFMFVIMCAPAFASQKYQTNISPAPRDGRNSANVQGRGMTKATLDGNTLFVHGIFAGLAAPATEADLCMGNVMGGTGPSIYELNITKAQSGEFAGTFSLTPDQITALDDGKIYVLVDSQTAHKGNLWGWFQPAHVTAVPDVPQKGRWYIPNILKEQKVPPKEQKPPPS